MGIPSAGFGGSGCEIGGFPLAAVEMVDSRKRRKSKVPAKRKTRGMMDRRGNKTFQQLLEEVGLPQLRVCAGLATGGHVDQQITPRMVSWTHGLHTRARVCTHMGTLPLGSCRGVNAQGVQGMLAVHTAGTGGRRTHDALGGRLPHK